MVQVRIPDPLAARVAVLAAGEQRSVAQMVALLLERALAGRGVAGSGEEPGADAGVQSARRGVRRDGSALAAGSADVPRPASASEDRWEKFKDCTSAFKHHNHHGGKPCPSCGYPGETQ